jgi:hypothetical protein
MRDSTFNIVGLNLAPNAAGKAIDARREDLRCDGARLLSVLSSGADSASSFLIHPVICIPSEGRGWK